MLEQNNTYTLSTSETVVVGFMSKVYIWMTFGLMLTAIMSLVTVMNQPLLTLIVNNQLVIFIALLGLVIALSAAINKISAFAATLMFLLYSTLMGAAIAPIFLAYTQSSIALTFFVASGTFGAMSVFGYVTKKDLTGWGNFLIMGLFGIIIASIANFFMQNAMIYWVTSYVGVLIFVGLTAYDTQKIKRLGQASFADGESRHKAAIIGALTLYLDFINLFLMLLRIMGDRR